MKKLILFVFLVLFLSGCTSNGTGNFQIYLKDLPIDNAEEILVTISEINVQKEGEGFLTIWTGTKTYDLLKLRSQAEKLVDVTLNEGTYTQIRLVVASGQIVIAGESHEMIIPSSEVKIPLLFNIMEGGAVEVLLDFEADESIHVEVAGQSNQYILIPVIRVETIIY
jgi:hypothetical protein